MKNIFLIFGFFFSLFIFLSCQENQKKEPQKSTEPIVISNPEMEASTAYLTEDHKSRPILSWVEIDSSGKKNFYFSKMDTAHHTFGEAISVPIEQNASIHEEGMPKIAVKGDGSLFATYETSVPLEGSDWGLGDLRYTQSFDNGKSWTNPQSVAPKDLADEKSSGFSNITRLGDGEIGLAWLSDDPNLNEGGRPVKFVKTKGKGLSKIKLIDKQACECCRMALASDSTGTVALAYRNLQPENIRDISISVSNDDGESFNKPNSFSDDNWQIDGCPHNGPAVTISDANILATWFTGSQNHEGVYYAILDKSGEVLQKKNLDNEGRFIQINTNKDPIIAYNEDYKVKNKSYRKLLVNRLEDDQIFEKEISLPETQANYPVIQGLNNKYAVVAWTDNDQVLYRVINTDSITEVKKELPSLISSNQF